MKTDIYPLGSVLIVDDEEDVVRSLSAVLKSNGINHVIGCRDSRKVMDLVQSHDIEAILLDLSMPYISGDELLKQIHEDYPFIPVIIVTATDEVKAAVECMKQGAFDYMVKAVEENRLVSGVKRAVQIRELRREYSDLRSRLLTDRLNHPEAFYPIITQNRKMQSIFLYIESVARTSEPVLITGETGVGKNLLADAIHKVSGRVGNCVSVNVAGLDDDVFADTLFGHRKGAFTSAVESREGLIQQAREGTLFLDEIGDLSIRSQVKLLMLLDTREYYPLGSDLTKRTDARIVLATNRDVVRLLDENRFRKDLYYRLSTHEIHVPPLRERKEDLPLLLGHFLDEAAGELGGKKPAVPPELLTFLETYHFPGNVRELRAMIFNAMSTGYKKTLSLSPFKEATGRIAPKMRDHDHTSDFPLIFGERLPTIKEATDFLISEAVKRAKGNQSVAAGILGISHQALNKRLQRKCNGE